MRGHVAEVEALVREQRDATRHQLAEQQLRGLRPISAIAEALGFADESAFAKAFRRWAG